MEGLDQHSSSSSTTTTSAHPMANPGMKNDNPADQFHVQLIASFAAVLDEKVAPIYEILTHHSAQMDRLENLLTSVVTIKYPELKRKGMVQQMQSPHGPVPMHQQAAVIPTHQGTIPPVMGNELVRMEEDEDEDTPKKRRRIYSHDISSKINSMLEPLFEENWKITREKERELGERLAREIGVEPQEGNGIVKSFWHRSRGNSKRLFTQLDDYRQGLEMIQTFEPIKKADAMRRLRIDSDDVIHHDLNDVNSLLEVMRKKGSSRTAAKTPKTLRRIPDTGLKTYKGRAAALCNHMFKMVHEGYDQLIAQMDAEAIHVQEAYDHIAHLHSVEHAYPQPGYVDPNSQSQ